MPKGRKAKKPNVMITPGNVTVYPPTGYMTMTAHVKRKHKDITKLPMHIVPKDKHRPHKRARV